MVVGFPSQVSSSLESGKYKRRVTHKCVNCANKNYANFWFSLLQVAKDPKFQRNKNACFISINLKIENNTMWSIYFNQQTLRYQCLKFTILKRDQYLLKP